MPTITAPTAPSPDLLCEFARAAIARQARRLIGHYGFTDADRDDIEQELTQRLLVALLRFDPAVGPKKPYVVAVLGRIVLDLVRVRTSPMRDYRRHVGCGIASDPEGDERGRSTGPNTIVDTGSERAFARSDLRMDVAEALDSLPPELSDLCRRLATQTVLEIARDRGVPRSRLYAAMERIRRHFIRLGLAPFGLGADKSGPTHEQNR